MKNKSPQNINMAAIAFTAFKALIWIRERGRWKKIGGVQFFLFQISEMKKENFFKYQRINIQQHSELLKSKNTF